MNIYDISKIAGVSIATVSRVFNNSAKVSDAARKRVLDAAESTGYRPGTRSVKNKSLPNIGIVCRSITNPRSSYLISRIIPALFGKGLTPLLLICNDNAADLKHAFEYFARHKTSAVIVDCLDFTDDTVHAAMQSAQYPETAVILLNLYIDAPNVFCALCDMEKAVASITDKRIKDGCKSPVFLFSGMSDFCISMLNGFKHACGINNLNIPPENLHICPDGITSAYNYTAGLMSEGKNIDAVICSDNNLGLGAYKAVCSGNAENYISITGCGCTSFSDTCPLPFPSIYCRDEEIFRHTMDTLANLISNKPVSTKTVFTPIYIPC